MLILLLSISISVKIAHLKSHKIVFNVGWMSSFYFFQSFLLYTFEFSCLYAHSSENGSSCYVCCFFIQYFIEIWPPWSLNNFSAWLYSQHLFTFGFWYFPKKFINAQKRKFKHAIVTSTNEKWKLKPKTRKKPTAYEYLICWTTRKSAVELNRLKLIISFFSRGCKKRKKNGTKSNWKSFCLKKRLRSTVTVAASFAGLKLKTNFTVARLWKWLSSNRLFDSFDGQTCVFRFRMKNQNEKRQKNKKQFEQRTSFWLRSIIQKVPAHIQ